MITLKFPKLEKALQSNVKDELKDSPLRGIIILNDKAIVYRYGFLLAVDLYDYFVIDCGISDDEELKVLKGILMYMNGKVFSGEFWSELTKGANMKMNNGALYVENPRYSKDLHYKHLDINIIEPLQKMTRAISLSEALVGSISIPFATLKTIYDVLPSDFKTDNIIFEFHSQDALVKYTFKNRKHFFGYIHPDYNSAQEAYKFDSFESFVEDFQEHLEELVQAFIPPPPPSAELESAEEDEVINKAQLKLSEDGQF